VFQRPRESGRPAHSPVPGCRRRPTPRSSFAAAAGRLALASGGRGRGAESRW
jgi:hypothetical protein